jgi:hypothetical protein
MKNELKVLVLPSYDTSKEYGDVTDCTVYLVKEENGEKLRMVLDKADLEKMVKCMGAKFVAR